MENERPVDGATMTFPVSDLALIPEGDQIPEDAKAVGAHIMDDGKLICITLISQNFPDTH